MSTSTATLTESSSQLLASSTSSLSSQHGTDPRLIARIYKQAADLFVTRRVEEALELLTPLLETPPAPESDHDGETHEQPAREPAAAPIATASRGARVKVWTLYISILNSIVEMGPDQGRSVFGNARWKELVAKVKEGKLWQDVVEIGYGGIEGEVDADVVVNLATLLLAHAPSQRLTQQRLETYLSASSTPSLDVEGHMRRGKSRNQSGSNGTSTPRDLNQRLKILEIYTLHVLPRNQEWEYAREFISMSEVLDEERREAFLQALQQVQDERAFDSKREEQLQRERDQQLEAARQRDEEARKAQQAKGEEEEKRRKDSEKVPTTEGDYGVDRSTIGSQPRPSSSRSANPAAATSKSSNSRSKSSGSRKPSSSSSSAPARRPATLVGRMSAMLGAIQQAILAMGHNFRTHPMLLLRLLAFFVALLMALSRADVRDRLIRLRDASWNKIKQTVGMGVKVSYI